jgi:hypothetical protein
MPQIPLYKTQNQAGVVSQPRGNVQQAGAVWDAVARAGDQVSGLGEKMMAYSARKAELQDSADIAKSVNAFQNMDLAAEQQLSTMTNPDEMKVVVDVNQKKKDEYFSSLKLSPRAKEKLSVVYEDSKEKFRIKSVGTGGYIHKAEIGIMDSAFVEIQENAKRGIGYENPETGETLSPKNSIEYALSKRVEIGTINPQDKPKLLNQYIAQQESVAIETHVNTLKLNNNAEELDRIATVGEIKIGSDIIKLSENQLAGIKYESQVLARNIGIDNSTVEMNDAIAFGDFDTGTAARDKLINQYNVPEVQANSIFTRATLGFIGADRIETKDDLNKSMARFDSVKNKLKPKDQVSMINYFNKIDTGFKSEASTALYTAVKTKDPNQVEALRSQMVQAFDEQIGNASVDSAKIAASVGNINRDALMNPSAAAHIRKTDFDYGVVNDLASRINDINKTELDMNEDEGEIRLGHFTKEDIDFKKVSELQSEIEGLQSSPEIKNALYYSLMEKIIPNSLSPSQKQISEMFNMTQKSVISAKDPSLWKIFYKFSEKYYTLVNSGDLESAEKVRKEAIEGLSLNVNISVMSQKLGLSDALTKNIMLNK